jgi:hypothetical protein
MVPFMNLFVSRSCLHVSFILLTHYQHFRSSHRILPRGHLWSPVRDVLHQSIRGHTAGIWDHRPTPHPTVGRAAAPPLGVASRLQLPQVVPLGTTAARAPYALCRPTVGHTASRHPPTAAWAADPSTCPRRQSPQPLGRRSVDSCPRRHQKPLGHRSVGWAHSASSAVSASPPNRCYLYACATLHWRRPWRTTKGTASVFRSSASGFKDSSNFMEG